MVFVVGFAMIFADFCFVLLCWSAELVHVPIVPSCFVTGFKLIKLTILQNLFLLYIIQDT